MFFLCDYHVVLITIALQYSLKSGSLLLPNWFFFLNIALTMGSFVIPKNFSIIYHSSVKNDIVILIRIALNLEIAVGSMDILMILILPVHEHGISFHLFVSS